VYSGRRRGCKRKCVSLSASVRVAFQIISVAWRFADCAETNRRVHRVGNPTFIPTRP
jgi:hypothetical protein